MNKYIKDLINTYYLNEKLNHDLFNGRGVLPYDMSIIETYNIDNISNMSNMLYEEYHISNMFDEVIDSIVELYKNNHTKDFITLYTGYSLQYIENVPTIIKLNKPNNVLNYPIYIKIINDPTSNIYAASEDKNKDIVIQINSSMVNQDLDLLRASCKHEFLHIREMYAKEFDNILQHKKNKIPEKFQKKFLWDYQNVELIAYNAAYVFLQSELRARINAYNEYIKNNHYKTFKESLQNTEDITLYDYMQYIINRIDLYLNTDNVAPIEIFMFYFQQYSITHIKYKSYSFNKRKMYNTYTTDEFDIINAFLFELKHTLLNFRNDLHRQYYKVKN